MSVMLNNKLEVMSSTNGSKTSLTNRLVHFTENMWNGSSSIIIPPQMNHTAMQKDLMKD